MNFEVLNKAFYSLVLFLIVGYGARNENVSFMLTIINFLHLFLSS